CYCSPSVIFSFMNYDCSFLRFILIFFFNHTTSSEIYTLSLHDALPILLVIGIKESARVNSLIVILKVGIVLLVVLVGLPHVQQKDRKSTRLNSSHGSISYAVFCLKKKIEDNQRIHKSSNTILHCLLSY